ncbi:hypothetical protein FRC02_000701 [Tulasnella sp. 418]|nr:hypothetical protein FRC02_000701 [Tulasnella sp. 418]
MRVAKGNGQTSSVPHHSIIHARPTKHCPRWHWRGRHQGWRRIRETALSIGTNYVASRNSIMGHLTHVASPRLPFSTFSSSPPVRIQATTS